jgi:hypothetical protein
MNYDESLDQNNPYIMDVSEYCEECGEHNGSHPTEDIFCSEECYNKYNYIIN